MCVVLQNFFTETCLTNNYFSRDPHFVNLSWAQSWNIFKKLMNVCSPPEFIHKNMSHEQLLFTWSTFSDSSMGTKLKYIWKTHECVKSAWIYFQKHVSRTIAFSRDSHFVILAWVQSWNIFEKLMKVCSPPDFFHKKMSHEQLLFTWSIFLDSSMGTKFKYIWKAHETVKSAWIVSQKHVWRTITFHVIHISWF